MAAATGAVTAVGPAADGGANPTAVGAGTKDATTRCDTTLLCVVVRGKDGFDVAVGLTAATAGGGGEERAGGALGGSLAVSAGSRRLTPSSAGSIDVSVSGFDVDEVGRMAEFGAVLAFTEWAGAALGGGRDPNTGAGDGCERAMFAR